jgi:glycosyltransferase involved in cell wall biosynthesis
MIIGIDIRNIGKNRTGDEVVFFNYVKNLALIDNENNYELFTDINDESILEKIKKDLEIKDKQNFKIISLKSSDKFFWNIWTLPRYLKKNPLDVYHTQYITPFFVSKKVKIITTIHDISFNFYPQFIKFFDLLFLKLLIPISLKRADKIIAVSEFTKNELIKYYHIAPEKITVAYNSVGDNFSEFNYSEEMASQFLKTYKLKAKSYILYLGTMQPRKNLPILIEAFAKIKDTAPEIKLVLAGNKNAYNFDKKIDIAIEKYNLKDDVIFTGYINEENKPILYKLASLFVFPSLYEGFGVPILEAMSAETPVVASDISPHREIAGNAAQYFNPEKPDELAQKISEIINNVELRNSFSDKEKEQVRKFSWKETAKTLLDVYRETAMVDNKTK